LASITPRYPAIVSTARLTYRHLLRQRSCLALTAVAFTCRLGLHVWKYGLILLVVTQMRAPWLAGLAVLCNTVPALLAGPVAGAAMDRFGATRLLLADSLVSAAAAALIVVLALVHRLEPPALLAVVAVSAVTTPFSTSGLRSLFPSVVPERYWGLMNGVDLTAYEFMRVAASAVAGVLVTAVAPAAPLAAAAVAFAATAALVLRVPEASTTAPVGPVLAGARRGLAYVLVENRTLRGLAAVMTFHGAAMGAVLVAVPVLALTALHGGPVLTGQLWALQGVTVVAGGALAGRLVAAGRERTAMIGGLLGMAAGYGLVAAASGRALAAAAVALAGLCSGPFSVGVLSLRQRCTSPAMQARAITTSMTVNSVGLPAGAAAAGFLLGWLGGRGTTVLAAVLLLAAALAAASLRTVRPRVDAVEQARVRGGSAGAVGSLGDERAPGVEDQPVVQHDEL
jgi:hypothetical protein